MDCKSNENLSREEYKEFLFPENDKRLTTFKTFNREKQLNSIYIGSIITEIGEEKYINLKSGENKVEKDKLEKMYNIDINELNEKIKRIEYNKQEREKEYLKEKEGIRENIKQELNKHHEERYSNVKDELIKIKLKWEEYTEKRLEIQKENSDKLLFQKDEMERKLNEQRELYEKKIDDLRKKIDSINNVTDISTKKGQEGESWVYNELVRQFKSAQVQDCHTKGHKGDFTITEGDVKGMFESKNYTNNVPKREIQKFKKDIEKNADLRYGVLISLKSGIVNHKDFCLEFCGGKPIVYLHDVKKDPFKIKVAYDICQLILKNIDCFDITKEEMQQQLIEKIKFITKRHKKMNNMLTNFTNNMKDELEEQWVDFKEFIEYINLKN